MPLDAKFLYVMIYDILSGYDMELLTPVLEHEITEEIVEFLSDIINVSPPPVATEEGAGEERGLAIDAVVDLDLKVNTSVSQ